jgi:hypothetical protein
MTTHMLTLLYALERLCAGSRIVALYHSEESSVSFFVRGFEISIPLSCILITPYMVQDA